MQCKTPFGPDPGSFGYIAHDPNASDAEKRICDMFNYGDKRKALSLAKALADENLSNERHIALYSKLNEAHFLLRIVSIALKQEKENLNELALQTYRSIQAPPDFPQIHIFVKAKIRKLTPPGEAGGSAESGQQTKAPLSGAPGEFSAAEAKEPPPPDLPVSANPEFSPGDPSAPNTLDQPEMRHAICPVCHFPNKLAAAHCAQCGIRLAMADSNMAPFAREFAEPPPAPIRGRLSSRVAALAILVALFGLAAGIVARRQYRKNPAFAAAIEKYLPGAELRAHKQQTKAAIQAFLESNSSAPQDLAANLDSIIDSFYDASGRLYGEANSPELARMELMNIVPLCVKYPEIKDALLAIIKGTESNDQLGIIGGLYLADAIDASTRKFLYALTESR